MTYDLLDSTTLTSSASSVTLSGISQDYRDLILVTQAIPVTTATPSMLFNSDTGENYHAVTMRGNGSTTTSVTRSPRAYLAVSGDESLFENQFMMIVQIMDYSATDKHKSVLSRAGRASGGTSAIAGRWASTAAITSVTLNTLANDYAAGTTVYLYGISA